MQFTWKYTGTQLPQRITTPTPAAVAGDGKLVLPFGRFTDNGIEFVVAEPDGPVRHAVLSTRVDRCLAGATRTHGDRFVARVYDSQVDGKLGEKGGGAIGGNLDDLGFHVVLNAKDTLGRSFYASDTGAIELITGWTLRRYDWTTSQLLGTVPSTGGAQTDIVTAAPGNVFFWVSSSSLAYEKVWTADGGVRDHLRYVGDPSKGVGPIGTDGTDMVWVRGSGRQGSSGAYPTLDVMTAPFTTDASTVQERRLRSEGGPVLGDAWVVGCGYAAHSTFSVPNEEGILIVRLSDGRAWRFTGPNIGPNSDLWLWGEPLALTCTELFANVIVKSSPSVWWFNVARVRLDSLGPGLPPD
jgi:hypothetical protein